MTETNHRHTSETLTWPVWPFQSHSNGDCRDSPTRNFDKAGFFCSDGRRTGGWWWVGREGRT